MPQPYVHMVVARLQVKFKQVLIGLKELSAAMYWSSYLNFKTYKNWLRYLRFKTRHNLPCKLLITDKGLHTSGLSFTIITQQFTINYVIPCYLDSQGPLKTLCGTFNKFFKYTLICVTTIIKMWFIIASINKSHMPEQCSSQHLSYVHYSQCMIEQYSYQHHLHSQTFDTWPQHCLPQKNTALLCK